MRGTRPGNSWTIWQKFPIDVHALITDLIDFHTMLGMLEDASPLEAFVFFLGANIVIFISSIVLCYWLGFQFKGKRIFDRWEPLRPLEVGAALGSIGLNALISILGWWLWKNGLIVIYSTSFYHSIWHCIAMTLFMDLGMYVFHRLAHSPVIFRLVHSFHHRHETTNPISLFVLHPAEVVGFGLLMIVYLLLFPIEITGLMGYLTLNVLWGTLGHSGVEPLPARFGTLPLLKLSGTSTFHAEHHEHPQYNFGFYTLIWDKLFGTLDPEYDKRFKQGG